jgi:hypothetical protein
MLGVLAIAGVTVNSRGDNIGVYTPLLATLSVSGRMIFSLVFVVLVFVWCLAGPVAITTSANSANVAHIRTYYYANRGIRTRTIYTLRERNNWDVAAGVKKNIRSFGTQ